MSSVTRAIAAVELLARSGPLGVRAIASQLDMPLGSTHRLLNDLAEEAVVERDPDGDWVLGYRLLAITGAQLDRIELPRLTRPFAERIATATRESVNLSLLDGFEGVTIDKVRGNERMQLDLRIGARGPIHAGGAAKAMLAFLPEADRRAALAAPRTAFTPMTLVDGAALEAELDRIRRRGYAIDDQEVVTGVFCVGVPILDRSGLPVAALSIAGPSHKAPGPRILPLVAMLSEACEHVSRRLGYTGAWLVADLEPDAPEPVDAPAPSAAGG